MCLHRNQAFLLNMNASETMTPNDKQTLNLEQLENRMMLSTVQVFAAGDTGEETFDVYVGGEIAGSFNLNNVANELQLFEFETEEPVDPSDLRIEFTNDAYDAETGFDRNLTVDRIVIDFDSDNTVYTASETVFTNGTYINGVLKAGFGLGDTLYTNGYYQYGQDPTNRSDLTVYALGVRGEEEFEVLVDDQRVAVFSTADQFGMTAYHVSVNQPVTPSQVKVQFINDLYLPDEGIDRNLIVDRIEINNVAFPTESPEVFSTGTYIEGPGVIPGFLRTEILHTDGYFQYADIDLDLEAPTVSLAFAADVTDIATSRVEIGINLADNIGIGFPRGPSPITVVGPAGQEFVPVEIYGGNNPDGSLFVAYDLRTENGPFVEADNGTYEIFLNENAIQDSAGNVAAGGLLGTFEVNIANSPGNDLTPPTAQLLNVGAVFTDLNEPIELFAAFEDEVFIGAINNDALSISGPNGSALFAFTSSGGGFGNQLRTRDYFVYRNNQFEPLSPSDNGIYTVTLNEDSIFDQAGNSAPSQVLGTFELRLGIAVG